MCGTCPAAPRRAAALPSPACECSGSSSSRVLLPLLLPPPPILLALLVHDESLHRCTSLPTPPFPSEGLS